MSSPIYCDIAEFAQIDFSITFDYTSLAEDLDEAFCGLVSVLRD
jgi:hypothetical protein